MSASAVMPCGSSSAAQLREADDRRLGEVVEEAAAVVLADPVGDLDDQPSAATNHDGAARWLVMMWVSTACRSSASPFLERVLPERHRPLGERIATPDVVDEDVEPPAVFALDARQQLVDLVWVAVVDPDGDAVSAGGTDQLGGLLDRLGPVHRRPLSSCGAPGDVDGRARGAELGGDAAPGAPRGSGNERDLILKWLFHANI